MALCFDISIVSHGHGAMVLNALDCLADSLRTEDISVQVWVTLNIHEPDLEATLTARSWPIAIRVLRNPKPLGFGANHNQAFKQSRVVNGQGWFLVMNPDILWPPVASSLWQSVHPEDRWPPDVGMICPEQVSPDGHRQDFARELITPWGLALRTVRSMVGLSPSGKASSVEAADWVNAACVIFRAKAFAEVKGFDERYFMYCEDSDICLRLQLAGWRMSSVEVAVVHDAQRNTKRSLRHMRWHLQSVARMWRTPVFWRYLIRR